MGKSVGVDLHKGQFTVYWRSSETGDGEFARYGTNDTGYRAFESEVLRALSNEEEVRVAVESTGNARYFRDRIERLGVEVKVINTSKFKVVTESVKKTDRHDAATIAEFLEKEMLPEARLCSPESEELRRLLKTRTVLVRSIVAVKNQLHGMLLSMGIETKKSSLQSKKGRRRALDVLEEQGHTGWAVEPLTETIDRLSEQVKKIEKVLAELVAGDRMVELIMTIPGAGLITAATIRAYTDDIGRFSGPKKYAAYAGVVPWVSNSADRERHGHITKRGPEELRTALVQVVMGMVRNKRRTGTYRLMERYTAMKQQKGSGRTIIATARKLSTIIWHMLTHDEAFDQARMTDEGIRKIATEMRAAAIEAA